MKRYVTLSMFMVILWTATLLAGEFQYNFHYKGEKPGNVSEAEMKSSLSEVLKIKESGIPYYKAGVFVFTDSRGALDFYEVLLYRSDIYQADFFKVESNGDRGFTVIKDYTPPIRDDESFEDERGCPDETVDIVVSAAVDYATFPLAHQKVDEAYTILTNAGYNVVKLHYQYATADTVHKYLSCNNLKMWARLGHGTEQSKLIVMYNDVYLRPSYFAAFDGALQNKIMHWNSCFVHAEPMKGAVIEQADAYFFSAGANVTLLSNSSEHAWYGTIEDGIIKGEEFGAALTKYNAYLNPNNRYGFTRNPAANGGVYWDDLTKASITVTSPNGGEVLYAGASIDITWKSNADGAVTIKLLKGASTVETIVSNTDNDGLYSWDLPNDMEEGSDYKITLLVSAENLDDESDASFEIKHKASIICDNSLISIKGKGSKEESAKLDIGNGGKGDLSFTVGKRSGTNKVLINELYVPHDAFFDGLELWNRGEDQDMSGWVVEWKDSDNTSGTYSFPDGFLFESGKTLVLLDDQDLVNDNTFYIGKDLSWSKDDGTELSIAITDKSGLCVDFVKSLGSSETAPDGACWNGDGIEIRLERHQRASNSDNDNALDWRGENGKANINKLNKYQTLTGIGKCWLSFTPMSGTVSSNGKVPIDISFDPTGLEVGDYFDTLIVSHDAPDREGTVEIPLSFTVVPDVAVDASLLLEKDVFMATSQGAKVLYTIPSDLDGQEMTISLCDLQGKMVKTLATKKHTVGLYQLSLVSVGNRSLAAGQYICLFKASSFSKAIKVIIQ